MFKTKTCFILGAGASWHYGYPTGESLVELVQEKAKNITKYFASPRAAHVPKIVEERFSNHKSVSEAWAAIRNECTEIHERLKQVQPPVIDYFLTQNEDLRQIGKFLITWIILECEHRYRATNKNSNRDMDDSLNDNWCRLVLYKLLNGCLEPKSLLDNKVNFVTFNYDLSLEEKIHSGLRSTGLFNGHSDVIEKFISSDRFIHVYGSIRNFAFPASPSSPNFPDERFYFWTSSERNPSDDKKLLDNIFEASKGINTIEAHDKNNASAAIDLARQVISDAQCIYILGYGFDATNSKRLNLDESLFIDYPGAKKSSGHGKRIMFTNFLDRNQINKRASKLFFRTFGDFLPNQSPIKGDPNGIYYVEKSVRDVYNALQLDFDDMDD